jgi:hypothetical protein
VQLDVFLPLHNLDPQRGAAGKQVQFDEIGSLTGQPHEIDLGIPVDPQIIPVT